MGRKLVDHRSKSTCLDYNSTGAVIVAVRPILMEFGSHNLRMMTDMAAENHHPQLTFLKLFGVNQGVTDRT
jgi:hypothetical protein